MNTLLVCSTSPSRTCGIGQRGVVISLAFTQRQIKDDGVRLLLL